VSRWKEVRKIRKGDDGFRDRRASRHFLLIIYCSTSCRSLSQWEFSVVENREFEARSGHEHDVGLVMAAGIPVDIAQRRRPSIPNHYYDLLCRSTSLKKPPSHDVKGPSVLPYHLTLASCLENRYLRYFPSSTRQSVLQYQVSLQYEADRAGNECPSTHRLRSLHMCLIGEPVYCRCIR